MNRRTLYKKGGICILSSLSRALGNRFGQLFEKYV